MGSVSPTYALAFSTDAIWIHGKRAQRSKGSQLFVGFGQGIVRHTKTIKMTLGDALDTWALIDKLVVRAPSAELNHDEQISHDLWSVIVFQPDSFHADRQLAVRGDFSAKSITHRPSTEKALPYDRVIGILRVTSTSDIYKMRGSYPDLRMDLHFHARKRELALGKTSRFNATPEYFTFNKFSPPEGSIALAQRAAGQTRQEF